MTREIAPVEEQGAHARAAQHIPQVVSAAGGVHVDQNGADSCGARLQVDPFHATGGPHADAIAGTNAECPKAARRTRHLLAQLRVREADLLVAGDKRVPIGVPGGHIVEDLADRLFKNRGFGTARE